ncbi:MAG: hypothetical protein H8E25_14090 [Planctomycetes bacterium]|nr:hypothetical protein [Planctomycetota bacterium]
MEIKNTSKKPIKVPLPGGKSLFLGPSAKGQVNDKSAEHPPFQELVESGAIEVLGSGRGKNSPSLNSNKGVSDTGANAGGGAAMRRSGDR